MQTIRLRFADHAAALAALEASGWLATDPEAGAETVPPFVHVDGIRCDIDGIGLLRENAGTEDAPLTTTPHRNDRQRRADHPSPRTW